MKVAAFLKYMPILKQETKEIVLPVSKTKITIATKINYGIAVKIRESDLKQDENLFALASLCILDWDLTNEKKEKLEITPEIIKQLDHKDGDFLMNSIAENFDEKKN